mmetsp:Transcript_17919/g.29428  ORF Transcript_17919/g.29428 Transcript_17919/m.29428 type:complete len:413 (+) Transcript_17919:505-1743(+)
MVARLGRLLQHHERRRKTQKRGNIVPFDVEQVNELVDGGFNLQLGLGGHHGVDLQHLMSQALGPLGQLLKELVHGLKGLGVLLGHGVLRDLLQQRLVVGVDVDLDHVEDGPLAPLPVLARHVQLTKRLVGVVGVSVINAFAVVKSSLEACTGVVALGGLEEPLRLQQPPSPSEKQDQPHQPNIVIWLAFKELLEVINSSIVLILSEHEVGEHHGGLLVHRVDSQQGHTLVLTRIQLAPGKVKLGQRQHTLLMAVVVLEGLVVEAEGLVDVLLLVVVLGQGIANGGGHGPLLPHIVRLLRPYAAQDGVLQHTCPLKVLHRRRHVPCTLVHLCEQQEVLDVEDHGVHVVGILLGVQRFVDDLLRHVVLEQFHVQLCQVVPQHHLCGVILDGILIVFDCACIVVGGNEGLSDLGG